MIVRERSLKRSVAVTDVWKTWTEVNFRDERRAACPCLSVNIVKHTLRGEFFEDLAIFLFNSSYNLTIPGSSKRSLRDK